MWNLNIFHIILHHMKILRCQANKISMSTIHGFNFVGNMGNGLQFASGCSHYMKLISDTPHDYDTFAANCSSELFPHEK